MLLGRCRWFHLPGCAEQSCEAIHEVDRTQTMRGRRVPRGAEPDATSLSPRCSPAGTWGSTAADFVRAGRLWCSVGDFCGGSPISVHVIEYRDGWVRDGALHHHHGAFRGIEQDGGFRGEGS